MITMYLIKPNCLILNKSFQTVGNFDSTKKDRPHFEMPGLRVFSADHKFKNLTSQLMLSVAKYRVSHET